VDTLNLDYLSLRLSRWPVDESNQLQAWDAADEYLLNHLHEKGCGPQHAETLAQRPEKFNVLLINDSHGALTVALKGFSPQNWSDSFLSHRSAGHNLEANGELLDEDGKPIGVHAVPSTVTPKQRIDLLVIKIPKTTALLVDQLARIRPYINEHTHIVAGGMVKHLQRSAFSALESFVGPLTTSLARKKARLIFPVFDPSLKMPQSPYPESFSDAALPFPVLGHANVFSRDHLDQGARFFIEQYRTMQRVSAGTEQSNSTVVDLACGNGVLGLMYQQLFPSAKMRFLDESYSAVNSARDNYSAWFPQHDSTAAFSVADGMGETESNSIDRILCNPPFHQQHAMNDQVAIRLFEHAKRCLHQGGDLWVVANRHLAYDSKLKRLFGNSQSIAKNGKFAVYRVVRR